MTTSNVKPSVCLHRSFLFYSILFSCFLCGQNLPFILFFFFFFFFLVFHKKKSNPECSLLLIRQSFGISPLFFLFFFLGFPCSISFSAFFFFSFQMLVITQKCSIQSYCPSCLIQQTHPGVGFAQIHL